MSLDIEARLKEFLASAPQTIYMIEVISIAHSDLTQTYHLWREPSNGGVVDENDNVLTVRSTNFTVALAGTPDNLDQKLSGVPANATVKLDSGTGLEQHLVNIIPNSVSTTETDGNNFVVTFQVEAESKIYDFTYGVQNLYYRIGKIMVDLS